MRLTLRMGLNTGGRPLRVRLVAIVPKGRFGSTPAIENSEPNLRKGWEADIPAPFDYHPKAMFS
jgi:hypothetical protein